MPGGRRRVDRVLDPQFINDVQNIDVQELRRRRFEAEQEEADLSYLRRLLHGRIDILEAELQRRQHESYKSLIDGLTSILKDPVRTARGISRHLNVEPTRMSEHRRLVERLVADPQLSDVTMRSNDEIDAALEHLKAHEKEVSEVRKDVQEVVDLFASELTARYREGRASVDSLLFHQP